MDRALRVPALLLGLAAACAPGVTPPPKNQPSSALSSCPPAPAAPGMSRLLYTGASRASFGDAIRLEAVLRDGHGAPIGSAAISFALAGVTAPATTDSNGVARAVLPAVAAADHLPIAVTYAGDAARPPAEGDASIHISRADTTVRYTGSLAVPSGSGVASAVLTTADGAPVSGRTLTFNAAGASAHATTDAKGAASAQLSWPQNRIGGGSVSVSFAGDSGFEAAHAEWGIALYQPTSFVVWGGNNGGLAVGAHVNFWGANWSSQVTGGQYHGDSGFKGFAAAANAGAICEASGALDQNCWTARSGNAQPPSTLPQFIGVLVSKEIVVSGTVTYGNVSDIAVIKLDTPSTYAPNPGHPGWGTVVAFAPGGSTASAPTVQAAQSQPDSVLPGAAFDVATSVSNGGPGSAAGVSIQENVGSRSVGDLAANSTRTVHLGSNAASIESRRGGESSDDYVARLGSADGALVASSGSVSYAGPNGQPYAAIAVHSASALQLPRLLVQLEASGCAGPGDTVNYSLTATNVGSARAATVSAQLRLPDQTTANFQLGAIEPGGSASASSGWTLPQIAPKGAHESNAQFLARLQAEDGVVLKARASVNWTDAAGSVYGAVETPHVAARKVPIVTVSAGPAPTLAPGQTGTLSFTLTNIGGGNAFEPTVTVTGPDGSNATGSVDKLGPNDTANVQISVTAPKSGASADFAWSVVWSDAHKNGYGPVTGVVSVSLQRPLLTLSLQGPADAAPGQALTWTVTAANGGTADAAGVTVTATLPDGTTSSSALGTVAAGASASAQVTYGVPALAAKDPAESNEAYTARLQAVDGASLAVSAGAVYGDAGGNSYGADPATAAATEHVPVLSLSLTAPASATGGDTIQYGVAAANSGSGAAQPSASITLPGGATAVAALPSTLSAGASASAQAPYAIPHSQPAGSISAQAALGWTDAAGNQYGPLLASASTQVAAAVTVAVDAGADQTALWPPPPPQQLRMTQKSGSFPGASGVSASAQQTVVTTGGALEVVGDDGTSTPLGGLSGLNGGAVRSASGALFIASAGSIARMNADGSNATDPWAVLPGEQGVLSLAMGPAGDVYAASSSGNLWHVIADGQAASLGASANAWAGAEVIPNDPRWGALAGALVTSAGGSLYAFDGSGAQVASALLQTSSAVVAMRLAPAAARFVGLDNGGALWTADASAFGGDLLVACAGGEVLDVSWSAGAVAQQAVAAQRQQVLFSGQNLTGDIVGIPGDPNLFWISNGNGTVMMGARTGGQPVTLASGLSDTPGFIAADANNVYYTDTGAGTVNKVSRKGGAAVALASMQNSPFDLVVDASSVYWVNVGDNTFWKVPIKGGPPVKLADSPTQGPPYYYLALDSDYLYWQTFGGVFKVPLNGGAVLQLYTGSDIDPADIAVQDGWVYLLNYMGGTVMKLPSSGGTPTVLASGIDGPSGLAMDAQNLYFVTWPITQGAPGLVEKLPIAGGAQTVLAEGITLYMATSDADGLYWGDWDGGTVNRVPLTGPAQWVDFSLAGGAIAPPVATAQLAGSAVVTGASGDTMFAWSVVSGPGTVDFGSPSAAQTSATFGAPGEYVLQLTASAGGVSASDTVTVDVVLPQ